jgi:hypothetical protein
MPATRRVVKVFLASPGDLKAERLAARDVILETNQQIAGTLGYQFELVGWEYTVSQFGRPQEIINRELAQCELFVGMMWRKWGTPPDAHGHFTSGFEEEYATAIAKRETEKTPEIGLLFKEISPDILVDPGDELKKVLAFKEGVQNARTVYYQEFSDIRDFERKFRHRIMDHLSGLITQTSASSSPEEARSQSETQPGPAIAEAQSSSKIGLIATSSAAFMRSFTATAERASSFGDLKSVDVARFRLIAIGLGSSSNDTLSLGSHDANLLYIARSSLNLGRIEISCLVDSGLRYLASENLPLWFWLASSNSTISEALAFGCLYESSNEIRQNALRLMTTAELKLPSERVLGIETFRALLLGASTDAADSVRVAALEYLSELGTPEDLPSVEQEFARNSSQTANAAANAIVRIALRQSLEHAIDAMIRLQSADVSKKLASEILPPTARIDAQKVITCLSHRSFEVRLAAIEWLDRRALLEGPLCEGLLVDSNPQVRYQGMIRLLAKGRYFDAGEIQRLLAIPRTGLLSSHSSETLLQRQFKEVQLRSRLKAQLDVLVEAESIYNREATIARADKYFAEYGNELRALVADRFARDFQSGVDALEGAGATAEEIKKTTDIRDYCCKEHTYEGLRVIARKADRIDIDLVRAAVADEKVDVPLEAVEYLGKFGGWKDIALIEANELRISQRPSASLFDGEFYEMKNSAIAMACIQLSRGRLEEAVQYIRSTEIRRRLMAKASKVAVRELSDAAIIESWNSDQDAVRKVSAIQCARSLSKRRLERLLSAYLAQGTYFYNVVHWIDLALSAPKEIVIRVLEGALKGRK